MTGALDVVRDVYSRFAEADIDGFLGLCAEDIEWVVYGPATLEKCSAFYGRDGVREFLDILDASWEFSAFRPREFIVDDPTVVVLGEEAGTDKASGAQFSNHWAHVFNVKDGQIARFREYLCHWIGDQKPPATRE